MCIEEYASEHCTGIPLVTECISVPPCLPLSDTLSFSLDVGCPVIGYSFYSSSDCSGDEVFVSTDTLENYLDTSSETETTRFSTTLNFFEAIPSVNTCFDQTIVTLPQMCDENGEYLSSFSSLTSSEIRSLLDAAPQTSYGLLTASALAFAMA
jgi:hypothetical protein